MLVLATITPILLTVAAAVLLWLQHRRAWQLAEEREEQRAHVVDEEIRRLRASIEKLERQIAATPPAPSAQAGINLNKRSQALRLLRRGDSTGEVAAAIGMSAAEVELLKKVHQVVIRRL